MSNAKEYPTGSRCFPPLLALLLLAGCAPETAPPRALPNVIYMLADDLGYGDVGAFNPQSLIPTPHLDRLAAEGMIFTDAHTTSAVCTPTRYGILTGRYNWRSRLKRGVLTGISPHLIPSSRTTVASLLKARGYQTAVIGKWHLGWDWTLNVAPEDLGSGWSHEDYLPVDFSGPVANGPNSLGFDYAYCLPASLDIAPYVYLENDRVTALPDTITVDTSAYGWWRKGFTGADFDHEETTPNFFRRAMHFVDTAARAEVPFFLYLPLPSPHTPILPTEGWRDSSGLNPYADFMMEIDHYVGELMATLAATGEDQNTLVIFTSDNGPSPQANFTLLNAAGHYPNHHFRGHKADLYEGGHRVPFIARWPDRIRAGSRDTQLLSTTDLLATLAEIAGDTLADNQGEDSFSFLPRLEGKDDNSRPSVIHHSVSGEYAIRRGPWKLILDPGSGGWSAPSRNQLDSVSLARLPQRQLYHLVSDPGETRNLLDTYPERATALRAELARLIRNGRSTEGASQPNDPPEKDGWPQADFALANERD